MSNLSRRHHYIPQFYLKGFTSENGSFKIFDVEKGKFTKNGNDFYPESFFFEIDANSVTTETDKDDFIETAYKNFDSMGGEIFSRINASCSSDKYNVKDDDIAKIQYFIGLMYWRIPTNRDLLESMIEANRFENLGIKIEKGNIKVDNLDFENDLKKNPNFIKFMRFLYPSFKYHETFECITPIHIRTLKEGGPLVCSDNPIICLNSDNFNIYKDDFIFPISSTRLFIRCQTIKEYAETEFSGFLKILMDTLVYKQAIKYVSCTDVSYLIELDKFYNKHYGNLTKLREAVVNGLINYTV